MSETNPIRKFRQARTRGNAIKAKCAECMGCTDYHLERGFRDLMRACGSGTARYILSVLIVEIHSLNRSKLRL